MSGRIWLESELGQGSTFHVEVPLPQTHEPTGHALILSAPELRGLSVLVVDDSATNCKILVETLRRWGCRPSAVDGAQKAISALLEHQSPQRPFELVLTDAQMPEQDGFMFIEAIRRFPELTQTAIMMLTSIGQYADTERCRSLHISAYLTKPVRQHELQEAILRVLGETKLKAITPTPATRRMSEVEPKLRVLIVEDNLVNQQVSSKLLQKWNYSVVIAGNGIEALAALQRTSIDLILMDLQMPEMDGFQTTDAIRREEMSTGRHIPIVALTAHAIEGDRQRCFRAGMDGHVSKPIRPEELKRVLDSLQSGREVPVVQEA